MERCLGSLPPLVFVLHEVLIANFLAMVCHDNVSRKVLADSDDGEDGEFLAPDYPSLEKTAAVSGDVSCDVGWLWVLGGL
jgi:hypothetical protein